MVPDGQEACMAIRQALLAITVIAFAIPAIPTLPDTMDRTGGKTLVAKGGPCKHKPRPTPSEPS